MAWCREHGDARRERGDASGETRAKRAWSSLKEAPKLISSARVSGLHACVSLLTRLLGRVALRARVRGRMNSAVRGGQESERAPRREHGDAS